MQKVSDYDQEIPQSQTAYNPMAPQSQTADNPIAPQGRATQPSRKVSLALIGN